MGLAYIKQLSTNSLLGIWKIEESLEELTYSFRFTEKQRTEYESRTTEKRKKEWIATRLLLDLLVEHEGDIQYTDEGMPWIAGGPALSISHSGAYLAILLDDYKPAGIDIQKIRPKLTAAKDYYLQTQEIDQLTNPDDPLELTLYWAVKEAVYKYIGRASTNLKNDIAVKPFRVSGEGLVTASISNESHKEELVLRYTHFDDYIMVFST
jgi:4'-phosphopantetheinyl transferase